MTLTPKQKEDAARALTAVMWGNPDLVLVKTEDLDALQSELAKVGLAIQPKHIPAMCSECGCYIKDKSQ